MVSLAVTQQLQPLAFDSFESRIAVDDMDLIKRHNITSIHIRYAGISRHI